MTRYHDSFLFPKDVADVTLVADDVRRDAEHLVDDRRRPGETEQCRLTAHTLPVPLECHQPDLGQCPWNATFMTGHVGRREHDVRRANDPRSAVQNMAVLKCERQVNRLCASCAQLAQVSSKHHCRRLVAEPVLEAVDQSGNCMVRFRFDDGHRSAENLRHHITMVQETTIQYFSGGERT